MTYLLVLGIVLFIMYIVKYNSRDKTQDYLYRRDMTPEKGDVDFGWDLEDLVTDAINKAKLQGTSEIVALTSLKDNLLKDIPNIRKKYNLDERRIRKNIYYFLDQKLDDLKSQHYEQ